MPIPSCKLNFRAICQTISLFAFYSFFSCRATEYPFWIGLIVPFVFIFIFNWGVFIVIMGTLIKRACDRTKSFSTDQRQLKRHFIIAFGLSTVFGLGWGFGLAATGSSVKEVTFVFQLTFSIFVGLQGVLIFILHGLRSQDARNLWKSWFSTVSFKSISTTDRFSTLRSPAYKQNASMNLSTLSSGSTLGRNSTTGTLKKQVEASFGTQSFRDSRVSADLEDAAVIENNGESEYEPNPEKKPLD